jgi:cobyrinic acid a,c-diamide synthase
VAAPFDVLVAIDVTNRVKSALATASGFVGFTFRTNTDGVISFGSLDTGPAPKLVILTE